MSKHMSERMGELMSEQVPEYMIEQVSDDVPEWKSNQCHNKFQNLHAR